MMWIWFALAILLLVVELATTQFVSIWFSVSALITGVVVAIFDEMGLIWQIVIFVVLAIGTLFATKPLVKRITGKPKDAKTNLELNIGKTAIVTETIDIKLFELSITFLSNSFSKLSRVFLAIFPPRLAISLFSSN